MKQCTKCKRKKDQTEFYPKPKAKDGIHPWCKSCVRADAKAYAKKNPEPYRKRAREQGYEARKLRQEKADQIKLARGCQCCSEKLLCVLDFHHLVGNSKGIDGGMPVSRAAWKSDRAFRRELSKCIVVCANCHRKIHGGIITLPADIQTCGQLAI